MSINIKNGELQRTINSAGSKLVAVDFSNEWCPPCRAIHPFWESLVPLYPQVVFCTVMCDNCPIESSQFQVQATPTFVFIRNGQELERFSGADKNKIKQALEKHKSTFNGNGHTIGQPMNTDDFFANLQKQRHNQQQPTTQPQQPPVQQPVVQRQEINNELLQDLLEMGFEEAQIKQAYSATNGGDMDAILQYFENVQNEEEKQQTAGNSPQNSPQENSTTESTTTPEAPKQNAKQEQVASDLTKPLTPEGEKAQAELISMGYDGEFAQMAINIAGHENLSACIDIIGKIQRGEPIPMPKHRKTQAEIDAQAAHYRELLAKKREEEAKKNAPKAQAKNELERRKQVLADIEFKKKVEEQKRMQAIQDAQREKIRERLEREKVRQKIQAQREEQKRAQQKAASNSNTSSQNSNQSHNSNAASQNPPTKKVPTECTLRLQMPDGSAPIQKFTPQQTLLDVEKWIRANIPASQNKVISFEMTFPRTIFTNDHFNKSLLDLQLCPRSQLMVKLV
ncbi:Thioredoxin family protein [Tritrichomonas foetus]|uniref:Thioredoxin family protein n=1 Tax=Tritrichomonas foetus TaxID=1144522 RepID=A0A1J4KYT1_9EUKA|nr:Thioredoxin family protein [Tritrichomonas foetus]|eukprot:OHT16407.1 Thioredoxin family protein [Tritrichomonas foetus]